MEADKFCNEQIPMYVLNQEQIEQIVMISAREGQKAFWKEQKKTNKKRAQEENKIVKTRNMLKSYRRIKTTLSDETEFTEEEKIELRWSFIEDLMGNQRESVSRSEQVIKDGEKRRQEDLYCIYRIEKAAEMFREECEKSGREEMMRRYRELAMMYLEEKLYTVQEIAEIEMVSDKTVYKDIGIACSIMAVYLFGI